MNKFAKILSVVLSVAIVAGVTVAMLVSAFAADTATFSVNKVSEDDKQIVVSVKFESGKVNAFDFKLETSDKIVKCSDGAYAQEFKDFREAVESNKGLCTPGSSDANMSFALATTIAMDKATTLYTFTLDKASAGAVTKDDIKLVVKSCAVIGADDKNVSVETATVINLPEAVTEPSKTEPSVTEPSETEPSKTEPSKTEPSVTLTEPSETKTEPSATEPSVTEPSKTEPSVTEPSETATSKTTETSKTEASETETSKVTTTTTVADTDAVTTTTTAAGSAVTNPNTGDSVTATAAIISLLAVSGAAVVALRKKED